MTFEDPVQPKPFYESMIQVTPGSLAHAGRGMTPHFPKPLRVLLSQQITDQRHGKPHAGKPISQAQEKGKMLAMRLGGVVWWDDHFRLGTDVYLLGDAGDERTVQNFCKGLDGKHSHSEDEQRVHVCVCTGVGRGWGDIVPGRE